MQLRRLYASPDGAGDVLATTSRGLVLVLRYVPPAPGHPAALRVVPLTVDDSDGDSEGDAAGRASGIALPFPAVDLSWCPFKSGGDHSVFLSASRSQPLHMWDATDGELRASYTAFSSSGAVAAPQAVCWRTDAPQSSLVAAGYGGHEDPTQLRLFDVLCPGDTAVWSYRSPSVRGVAAALGNGPRALLLVGYRNSGVVEAVDTRSRCPALALRGLRGGVAAVISNGGGGEGSHLVCAAGRCGDDAVHVWDVRRPADELCALRRPKRTHQHCDMAFAGGDLLSASTAGGVFLFRNVGGAAAATSGGMEGGSSSGAQLHSEVGVTSGLACVGGGAEVAVVTGTRQYTIAEHRSTSGCSFDDPESPLWSHRGGKRSRSAMSDDDGEADDKAQCDNGKTEAAVSDDSLNVRVLSF